jgi:hypothetical protein
MTTVEETIRQMRPERVNNRTNTLKFDDDNEQQRHGQVPQQGLGQVPQQGLGARANRLAVEVS